jgi:hypothetical protein
MSDPARVLLANLAAVSAPDSRHYGEVVVASRYTRGKRW